MISKIESRLSLDPSKNISKYNFNETIKTKVTNLTKVSSVGKLFLEL